MLLLYLHPSGTTSTDSEISHLPHSVSYQNCSLELPPVSSESTRQYRQFETTQAVERYFLERRLFL